MWLRGASGLRKRHPSRAQGPDALRLVSGALKARSLKQTVSLISMVQGKYGPQHAGIDKKLAIGVAEQINTGRHVIGDGGSLHVGDSV